MSDIVLGALIGVVAAVIGAAITGSINYKNSKLQISARRDEAQIDRLIKIREKVLIPLRGAISQSLELANNALVLMVQMGEAQKKSDAAEMEKAIQCWKEASEKSKETSTTLEILRGQVSDSQLYQMIDEVKKSQENENTKIIEITMRAHKPENWNVESMNALNNELKEVRKRIFNKLLPVNKRIDELLSSEPSS